MKKAVLILSLAFVVACGAEEAEQIAEQIAVGTKAPDFTLVDAVTGQNVEFDADDGKLKVVIFTCNQCPYAKAFEPRIIELAKRFANKGVAFYAVDPNDDAKYPEETLANMKARAVEKGYPFPYLKDGDSKVARAYGARVTPHAFLVDQQGNVRYRGYVDDSAKPDQRQNQGLANAINALIVGRDVTETVTREFGCGIKWKA
jgi:thiol-disulfide isomerase/thioredoxin